MPRGKIKFALRMSPEMRQLVKEMYPRDNCQTQNEFTLPGRQSGGEGTAIFPSVPKSSAPVRICPGTRGWCWAVWERKTRSPLW